MFYFWIFHRVSQFIQKRDPKYSEVKEETAWSMDRFNDYLNETVAPTKDLPQDWVYGHLDVSFYSLCQLTYAVFYQWLIRDAFIEVSDAVINIATDQMTCVLQ